eukprot:3154438-Rhodomonas_salina.1
MVTLAAFGVVASIRLTELSTESFSVTRQDVLLGALSSGRAVGVDVTELEVTGLENSGGSIHILVVQVVLAPGGAGTDLTALEELLRSVVISGAPESELESDSEGLEVGARVESVELGTTGDLPEVTAEGLVVDV